MKYHLKENGEPGRCKASVRDCPRGGADEHYTSPEAAREAFETKNEAFKDKTKVKPTLESIKETITDEDTAYGYDWAKKAINSYTIKANWSTLMGPDTRKTKNNIAKYEELRKDIIDNDESLTKQKDHWARVNANDMQYSRAYKLGVAIPKNIDEEFEKRWNQPYNGGEFSTQNKLRENKDLLEKLKNDQIKPKVILSSPSSYNNPKKVAIEHLEKEIIRHEESIATRGRSDTQNIREVKENLARAEREEKEKLKAPVVKAYEDYQYHEELSTHDLTELPSYISDEAIVYDRKNDLWVGSTNLVLLDKESADKFTDPDELAEYAYDEGGALGANTEGVTNDPYTKGNDFVVVDLDSGEKYDPNDLLIGGADDDPDLDYYEILDNTNGARDKWLEGQAIPIVSRASVNDKQAGR